MRHRILSMSVSEDLAREMESLQKDMGFSGRSDLIRAGLRKLLSESREKDKLVGIKECILLVVHNKQAEADITEAKHEFDDIISTQIHSNLKGGKCLETFIVSGKAERIRSMHNRFETNRKIEYVKLLVT